MYESSAPQAELIKIGGFLDRHLDHRGRTREHTVGFGSLRKIDMVKLCTHYGVKIDQKTINSNMAADQIAGQMELAWFRGEFGQGSAFDDLPFPQLVEECEKRELPFKGKLPEELKIILKAFDEMEESRAALESAGPETAGDSEGDQESGAPDQGPTVTPIKRGPGRPPSKK